MSKDLFSKQLQKKLPWLRGLLAATVVFWTLVLFIAMQFVGTILVIIGARILGYDTEQLTDLFDNSSLMRLIVIFVIDALIVGAIYGAIRFFKKSFVKTFELTKGLSWRQVGDIILTYGQYFLVLITATIAVDAFIPAIDTQQEQQLGLNLSASGVDLVYIWIAIVLLTAFTEELVLRGVLYRLLKKAIARWWAIGLTSVVFGLAHTEFLSGGSLNWISAIDTTLFSVFLIFVYERHKTLWAPILLHALKNSIAFVFLFLL